MSHHSNKGTGHPIHHGPDTDGCGHHTTHEKDKSPELGATGQFPDGKVNSDDDGEIRVAIGGAKGKVFIDFGPTPVRWVGFTPMQAIEIARSLVNAAWVAQGGTTDEGAKEPGKEGDANGGA